MGCENSSHLRGHEKMNATNNSDSKVFSKNTIQLNSSSKASLYLYDETTPSKQLKSSEKISRSTPRVPSVKEEKAPKPSVCSAFTSEGHPQDVIIINNDRKQKSAMGEVVVNEKTPLAEAGSIVSGKLSRRAQNIVRRVERILNRCRDSIVKPVVVRKNEHAEDADKVIPDLLTQKKEDIAMYEMFALLANSEIGSFYATHLELLLSNRSTVYTTPDFPKDWNAGGYCISNTYTPGTIGRSYLVTKAHSSKDALSIFKKGSSRFGDRVHSRDGLKITQETPYVLKVVNFVLRREVMDAVLSEQEFLMNTPCDNILGIVDILADEYKENALIVTEFHSKANVSSYAGNLDDSPGTLLRIIGDVALGMRFLNFNNIYHHNLKLENVLEMRNGRFCISDAGFSSLFTSQSPEALVFNGELGCLAPEVFNEDGPYADDSVYLSNLSVSKIDTWGFGVFMYCLAYGKKPFDTTNCDYEELKKQLTTSDFCFPTKLWPFANDLVKVISLCLTKNPVSRPDIEELLRMPLFTEYSFGPALHDISPLIRGVSSFNRLRTDTMFSTVSSMHSTHHAYQKCGYTVDRVLSRGNASVSFLVHLRRNSSNHFVLKALPRSIHKFLQQEVDEFHRDHILHQLAVIKKIRHCNLVQYLSIVDDKKGNCFLVQEYIQGKSLTSMLPKGETESTLAKQQGQLNISVCSDRGVGDSMTTVPLQKLLGDVLSGLVCLHDNGVPHLSLRPSNILYDMEFKNFKLNNYGPLFFTLHDNSKHRSKGKPFDHDARSIIESKSDEPFMSDTFSVGLLAASIVPKVFHQVWDQLFCSKDEEQLSVDSILKEISISDDSLPNSLVDFIHDALCKRRSARQLLRHAYFEGKFATYLEKSQKKNVCPKDLLEAIQSKPEERDEPRILKALGWVSFVLSPAPSMAGADLGELSTSNERPTIINFTSSGLRCTLCQTQISLALYRCLQCEECIRCGKCALNDNHKPGHQLMPFLVNVIEHQKDGTGSAVLCHPSSIPDVHALETIEMQANFPVGALSKMATSKRSLERSLVHSLSYNALNNNQSNSSRHILDTSYGTLLQDSVDSSPSSASLHTFSLSKRFSSVFSSDFRGGLTQNIPGPSLLNRTPSVAESVGNIGNISGKVRTARITSDVTTPTSSRSLLHAKKDRKVIKLPKAQDVEVITWQEELERCRKTNETDLLLFNYGFTKVPVEVFTPLPSHVVCLDLSQNALTSLPDELTCMMHLRKLLVSYNNLTSLPASIGNLTFLELIDASHNAIQHLPDTFASLVNLKSVAMDYNLFCEIPECILNIEPSEHSPEQEWQQSFSALPGGSTSAHFENLSAPALKVLYLAANDGITAWPEIDKFTRFQSLTIALDNEPALYRFYMSQGLESKLPNVTVNWNKIYPDEIIPYLYCGSFRSAQSQMVYRKLNISHVLTIGRGLVPVPPDGGSCKVIVVDDIPDADISYSFHEATEFINDSQQKCTGCLVHCFSGLSRSATIVIAYLMIQKRMRLDEAYMLTKKGRPAIFPNKGFLQQLIELDKRLYPNADRPLNMGQLERGLES